MFRVIEIWRTKPANRISRKDFHERLCATCLPPELGSQMGESLRLTLIAYPTMTDPSRAMSLESRSLPSRAVLC